MLKSAPCRVRRWADVLLIAPLSANTLGKLAGGLCDNLLTCVARAWDLRDGRKRMLVAPSMNTDMWEHPLTARQLAELQARPCGIDARWRRRSCACALRTARPRLVRWTGR